MEYYHILLILKISRLRLDHTKKFINFNYQIWNKFDKKNKLFQLNIIIMHFDPENIMIIDEIRLYIFLELMIDMNFLHSHA